MSIVWNAFEEKRVLAPWIPQLTCDTDTCNFNTKYTYSEVDPSSPTVCFCQFKMNVLEFIKY